MGAWAKDPRGKKRGGGESTGVRACAAPDIKEIQPGPSQWSSDLYSAPIDASYYYGYFSNAIDVNSTSQTQTKLAI